MHLSEFHKQPRGPRLFDTWLWKHSVETELGPLPVELYCDIDTTPSKAMINLAGKLAAFAEIHGALIWDLVYGHYRHAETNEWLRFSNVTAGLDRSEVLSAVEAILLNVHSDLSAMVQINPRWDPEHKLCLTFDGTIVETNDAPFLIENGMLTLL